MQPTGSSLASVKNYCVSLTFNPLHTTGSMNNVFRAIVSVTVTVLTAVIRFTVRLKEILNGALTWGWNVCKAIGNSLPW